MKDHENLSNHNMKDGLTVHLVIKTTAPDTGNNANQGRTNIDVGATPFGLGALGGEYVTCIIFSIGKAIPS